MNGKHAEHTGRRGFNFSSDKSFSHIPTSNSFPSVVDKSVCHFVIVDVANQILARNIPLVSAVAVRWGTCKHIDVSIIFSARLNTFVMITTTSATFVASYEESSHFKGV